MKLIVWDKQYQRQVPGYEFVINFEGQLIHGASGEALDLDRYTIIKQYCPISEKKNRVAHNLPVDKLKEIIEMDL